MRTRLPPARTRGSRARRPVASKAAADGTAAVPAAAAMDGRCASVQALLFHKQPVRCCCTAVHSASGEAVLVCGGSDGVLSVWELPAQVRALF